MADQTQGAVDSLVGLLSTAIKDEAKLLGSVGDMQFIKDEMESMNGFLLHLTKTDGLRAWMKQVRDIAYIGHDCIELYKRDFADPLGKGPWAILQNLPTYIRSLPARHRLANRIRELKVRVLDVGKRRQRYDISIPQAKESQLQSLSESQGNQEEINKIRQEFLRVLALDKQQQEEAPTFDGAIDLLPEDLKSAGTTVRGGLDEQSPATTRRICMEMLLCALRAHRKVRTANTKEELEKLAKAPDRTDLPAQVMIFCYSMLSRSYKSCFQYMCAFRDEIAISRTSLVRRWVAEGLVKKQDGRSLEEAAELCFQELLFRGFLLPHHRGDAGKVKSCKIDDTVWEFAYRMSASENFVSSLPTYLSYQLRIRKFVKEQEKELEKNPRPQEVDSHRSICGFRRRPRDDTKAMDDMVSLLGTLPQATG
ncbi:hypothetical protein BRADI_1g57271v3 [Brachypodium distachyon]|uniref:Uncharacterized protein n=2 Tax=Brachypodium distachyon TaxID=15368 RepID=A0A0Q3HDA2_BRADI|nr:hypothetical protein BRADI_1g57271v3 [Brachypodium distachyon]